VPDGVDSDQLFQSEAWLELLLGHGLEQVPVRSWQLALPLWTHKAPAGAVAGRLHLMQLARSGTLQSLSNYYSGLYGPVWATGMGAQDVDWDRLAADIRGLDGSAIVELQPLDAAAAFLEPLEAGLQRAGYWSDRFFCFGNWYCPVPQGGFAAYWEGRPSRLRNTVQRARKRLDKERDASIELHVRPGPELEAAILSYQGVYGRSWKSAEPRADFIPALCRMATARGWLRLGLLRVDGEVLAAQLWLVQGGKAYIFKLAYVSGHERLSPGSILTAHLMAHVMESDGVAEVDFLSGDDAYKADWMTHRRERIGLVAFDSRRPRAWMAAARHYAGKWWRASKT
jgi:ribosomal protein S18 acetylase RimI-like enzyme